MSAGIICDLIGRTFLSETQTFILNQIETVGGSGLALLTCPIGRVKIDTIFGVAQTRVQLIKSGMALNTESRIYFSIISTVFGYASSIEQHQSDLTLNTNVTIITGTALDLSNTLIVWVEFISRSACDTNILWIELFASWSAESLDIIVSRTALGTNSSIESATIIQHTESICIQLVSSNTLRASPSIIVKSTTLL